VFKDSVLDMAVEIRMLGMTTRENAKNNNTVMPTVGS